MIIFKFRLQHIKNIPSLLGFIFVIWNFQRTLSTHTAFQAFAEKAGLTFVERFEDRRIYVDVMAQTEEALKKFLAYSVAYLVFKSRENVSAWHFKEKLSALPELSSYYDADDKVKDDGSEWEKYVFNLYNILMRCDHSIMFVLIKNFLILWWNHYNCNDVWIC